MNFYTIVAVGFVGVITALTIKDYNKSFGMLISVATTILILLMILPSASNIYTVISDIAYKVDGNNNFYIKELFKIIGVSYLADISAELCKDAGEAAIGIKIELAGKFFVIMIGTPIIMDLLNIVTNINAWS